MKTKKMKWLAAFGLALFLGTSALASYAKCIECTDGSPNNGKCYSDSCSSANVQGGICCGNTAW